LPARSSDGRGGGIERLAAAACERHASAFVRKQLSAGAANAGARAGDECDFAYESCHVWLQLRV
jgi:hypothetical protein